MTTELDAPRRERELNGEKLDIKSGDIVLYLDPVDGDWKGGQLEGDPTITAGKLSMDIHRVGLPREGLHTVENITVAPKKVKPFKSTTVVIDGDEYVYELDPGPRGEEEYALLNQDEPGKDIHRVPRAVLDGYFHGAVVEEFKDAKEKEDFEKRAKKLSFDLQKKLRDLEVKAKEIEAHIAPLLSEGKQSKKKKLAEIVENIRRLGEQLQMDMGAFQAELQDAEAKAEKTKEAKPAAKEAKAMADFVADFEKKLEEEVEIQLQQKKVWDEYTKYEALPDDKKAKARRIPRPAFTEPGDEAQAQSRIVNDILERVSEDGEVSDMEKKFIADVHAYAARTKIDFSRSADVIFTKYSTAAAEAAKKSADAGSDVEPSYDTEKKQIEEEIKKFESTGADDPGIAEHVRSELVALRAEFLAIAQSDPKWPKQYRKIWRKLSKLHIEAMSKKHKSEARKGLVEVRKKKEGQPLPSDVVVELLGEVGTQQVWQAIKACYEGGDTLAPLLRVFTNENKPASEKLLKELRRFGYDEWEDFVDYWRATLAGEMQKAIGAWVDAEVRIRAARQLAEYETWRTKRNSAVKIAGSILLVGGGAVVGAGMGPAGYGLAGAVKSGGVGGALAELFRTLFGKKISNKIGLGELTAGQRADNAEALEDLQTRNAEDRHLADGYSLGDEFTVLKEDSQNIFATLMASAQRTLVGRDAKDKSMSPESLLLYRSAKELEGSEDALKFYRQLMGGMNEETQKQIARAVQHGEIKALMAHRKNLELAGPLVDRAVVTAVGAMAGEALNMDNSVGTLIDSSANIAVTRIQEMHTPELTREASRIKELIAIVQPEIGNLRRASQGGGEYTNDEVITAIGELESLRKAAMKFHTLPLLMAQRQELHRQLAVSEKQLSTKAKGKKHSHGHGHGGHKDQQPTRPIYTAKSTAEEMESIRQEWEALPQTSIAALATDPILAMQVSNILFETRWAELEKARVGKVSIEEHASLEGRRIATPVLVGGGSHDRPHRGSTRSLAAGAAPSESAGGHASSGHHDRKHPIDVDKTAEAVLTPKRKTPSRVGKWVRGAIAVAGLAGGIDRGVHFKEHHDVSTLVEKFDKKGFTSDKEIDLLVLNFLRPQIEKEMNSDGKMRPETADKASYMASVLKSALGEHKNRVAGVALPKDFESDIIALVDGKLIVRDGSLFSDKILSVLESQPIAPGVTVKAIAPEDLESDLKELGLYREPKKQVPPKETQFVPPVESSSEKPSKEAEFEMPLPDEVTPLADEPMVAVPGTPKTYSYFDKKKGRTVSVDYVEPDLGVMHGPRGKFTDRQGIPFPPSPDAGAVPEATRGAAEIKAAEIDQLSQAYSKLLETQLNSIIINPGSGVSTSAKEKIVSRYRQLIEHFQKEVVSVKVDKPGSVKIIKTDPVDEQVSLALMESKKNGGANLQAFKKLLLDSFAPAEGKALELWFTDFNADKKPVYTNDSAGVMVRQATNGGEKMSFIYQPGLTVGYDDKSEEIILTNTTTNKASRIKIQDLQAAP